MSKLRVNRKIYAVRNADLKTRDIRGSVDYARREILVDRDLFGYVRHETLLHEIQHACHEDIGIRSGDVMTAEEFITRSNSTLFRTLYENGYWRKPASHLLAKVATAVAIAAMAWIALPDSLCVSETGNVYDQSSHGSCAFVENVNVVQAYVLKSLLTNE